ncbi:MAG: FAD/NAD(P)-binding protein [Prochloraceae cyanobacterium]|nr:FAD/NAD(P)-binding protein [Prochloraceae cyanobacterium]
MPKDSFTLPQYIDLVIIGAGVQALTLTTHLLQKSSKHYSKFIVIDSDGAWMKQWHHQFAAQQIPHLRSPAVHHPDPNPYELRRFAQNRKSELFPPYDRPGTKLFADFCNEVIRRWRLEDKVYRGKVRQILPIKHCSRSRFQLVLDEGKGIVARKVVLAIGSGKLQLPEWVNRIRCDGPSDRLCHSVEVDLRHLNLAGERILVIGGGLTSAHLALGAINLGAKVTLMTRKPFQEKIFDTDPGWLGPKYLKNFHAERDWHLRWQMIQKARNGGSMTPAMMLQLRKASREGKIILNQNCQVKEATWQNNNWQVNCQDNSTHQFNRIWLATGTKLDAIDLPLLKDVLKVYPTEIVNGLPVLDDRLRLPKSNFFMMGALAALQIGPVARNIAGGIKACDRIIPALIKPSLVSI